MKVLVLAIYSQNDPVYNQHLECWRLYSKSHPSFDVFFVTLSEEIQEITLKDDILYVPGRECMDNLAYKTVKGFEYFRGAGYDLVIRTNMSSFWVFENLLPIVEAMPRQGLLAGELVNGDLVTGAGMFMSWDICEILIQTFPYLETFQTYWPDDARISHFVRDFFGVPLQQTFPRRFDILKRSQLSEIHLVPEDAFHIRVCLREDLDGDRSIEPEIMKALYKRFCQKKLNHESTD